MVQLSPKMITLEEFLELPETKPASEFVDGQILQKPMPKGNIVSFRVSLFRLSTPDLNLSELLAPSQNYAAHLVGALWFQTLP
jgi:Uma2 family endonuclease